MTLRYLATVGLALFVLSFLSSVTSGPNLADEVWFLQVVQRMSAGEVLYRDIRFNVLPLAPYLARPVTSLLGVELLVLKALLSLVWTSTAIVCLLAVTKLGVGFGVRFWLPVAFLVHANRFGVALYNPLAIFLLSSTFWAALVWRQGVGAHPTVMESPERARRGALLVGLSAGLCLVAKYTTGVAALGMVAGIVMVTPPKESREVGRDIALFAGGFLGVVAVLMIPVWLSGSVTDVAQIFDKSAYFKHGDVAYHLGLATFVQFLPPKSALEAFSMFQFSIFLLPPMAFLGLIGVFMRDDGDAKREAFIVLLYTLAGLTMLFPRADWSHLMFAMPSTLVGLAYGLWRASGGVPRRWQHFFVALGSVWLIVGLFLVVGVPWLRTAPAGRIVSEVPHFRSVLVSKAQWVQSMRSADALRAAVRSQDRMFILSPIAGFYYLLSGLENPTRYDYPLVSQFGSGGQDEVMAALDAGEISHVCVAASWPERLRPKRLIEFVEANLELVESFDACRLYTVRRPPSVGPRDGRDGPGATRPKPEP